MKIDNVGNGGNRGNDGNNNKTKSKINNFNVDICYYFFKRYM